MNRTLIMTLVSALLALGCEGPASDDPSQKPPVDSVDDQDTGQLVLELSSVDRAGRSYRLRNASIDIGPLNSPFPILADGGFPNLLHFSSEDYLEEERISVRLEPASYLVMLLGDWYLERLTPNGYERVERALLLSPGLRPVSIGAGQNAQVTFRFGVDGESIDFRYGTLDVGIAVELPGETGGARYCDEYDYNYPYYPYPEEPYPYPEPIEVEDTSASGEEAPQLEDSYAPPYYPGYPQGPCVWSSPKIDAGVPLRPSPGGRDAGSLGPLI